MPPIKPEQFIVEERSTRATGRPDRTLWISEVAGLTQFGAFIEELQPGSRSSLKHWHSSEDELVFVLDGEITLLEGDEAIILRPGDAAAFRAKDPVGHFLENRSASTARYLMVGTRGAVDRITYPDHDRVCHRDRSLPDDAWTDAAGVPASNPYCD